MPAVLTSEEIAEFSWRFDAIIANGKDQGDTSAPGARIFPDGHRVIVPLIEADPYFYNLLDHPKLASIAEDLLGADCIFSAVPMDRFTMGTQTGTAMVVGRNPELKPNSHFIWMMLHRAKGA